MGSCMPFLTVKAAAEVEPLKKRATYYTEEKRENARENIEKHAWAAEEKNKVCAEADKLLDLGIEYLRKSIPSQEVYRYHGVNEYKGCLNCGMEVMEYGNYGYTYDAVNDPWKITCPSCGMKFPTNDFEAFYNSALDENGNFDPSRGDKQYLVNTLYPEKGPDWGVDNGQGYVKDGSRWLFIGYYTHWALWYGSNAFISNAIKNLKLAYVYTGEQKYADACIVMLCRIADIYPTLDISKQLDSAGNRVGFASWILGKSVDMIWETGLANNYVTAYDACFDAFPNLGDEAKSCLATHYGDKSGYKTQMVKIENNIILEIERCFKNGQLRGNNGTHQETLALAAMVLDDPKISKRMLDLDFAPQSSVNGYYTGDISALFVDLVDRDGFGTEAAPGYNSMWISYFLGMANNLKGYKINSTGESYDIYDNIKFKKMFYASLSLIMNSRSTPSIGDSGGTGDCEIISRADILMYGYLAYKDPYLAQAISLITGGDFSSLRLTIFDKNPEEVANEIKAAAEESGDIEIGSVNLAGYGFASLKNIRRGKSTGNVYKNNIKYTPESLEILNLQSIPSAFKTESSVGFVSDENNHALTLCFYLDNTKAVYELIPKIKGRDNGGNFDVYVDSKLLQADVDINAAIGEEQLIYFRRTISMTAGLHMITFDAQSTNTSIEIVQLVVNKQSSALSGETVANPESSMYIYYGRNTGHGHLSSLDLGLYSFNIDMMPDLGYPEFANNVDPHRFGWVNNTISHNTVVVDKHGQDSNVVSGDITHYDESEYVKLVSVDVESAYKATSEYSRTSAMIDIDGDSEYLVDLFRVTGGTNHVYSFHGAESFDYKVEGLELDEQKDDSGNFVGNLLSPKYGLGETASGVIKGYVPQSGYQWLINVRRDLSPKPTFSVDYSITDTYSTSTAKDIHLKITSLGDCTAAYLATGIPPRNRAENPDELEYLLIENDAGSKHKSCFVTVIEPYTQTAKITASQLVPVTVNSVEADAHIVRALKITLNNGRIDYIVQNAGDKDTKYTVDGIFDFCGFFGVFSVLSNGEELIYTNDASFIKNENCTARITGKIADFTKELSDNNYITVTANGNPDVSTFKGRYIYIDEDSDTNACYRIISAKKDGDNYILDIGDVTTVKRYVSAKNPDDGYVYYFDVGCNYYIPLSNVFGDTSLLKDFVKPAFSDITLSNMLSPKAQAGDLVAMLYPVAASAKSAAEIPEYIISLEPEFGDGRMFEIKNNVLYLKETPDGSVDNYTLRFSITHENDNQCEKFIVSLRTMSEYQISSIKYPDFSLEYKPIPQKESDSAKSILPYVAGGIVILLCGIAAAFVIHNKKKHKLQ
ncbi:MAG: heparinase II/III family protein [Oscillospiraceae bacterium]|nr:heparinase II/III family protein [Oscillospiraceae bacterium]